MFVDVFLKDVTKIRNGERGTGNGEPGTGVWERVYRGNPHENSKWLTKPGKESEFNCDMEAKFFRLALLFAVIRLLAFISILPLS